MKREHVKGTRESLSSNSAFDRWWSTYPRREGKIAARKAYDRIVGKGTATADELQAGAERYAEARGGQDPQFTKMPTTWLNGGCWADEPAPVRPGGLNGAGRSGGFSALAYVAERIADDE
ncbi:hypothetical protein MPEAHAMD_4602 [Methylobacterium frigidaeris]|uniref:Uncharacterized protein n=1 Tax=Methylobacterium frigidaeris TaxID=2038277 RepID=A0AA37M6D6_9HYPH|nr:hypothetical protein MPEAHAMD_4602 [Methylobacterium frigidaeris]